MFKDLTDSPSHGRKMGHTSKNGSHLNSRHFNFDQEMTTSMREPTTCVWIPPNIFRQDGAVWSKNSKIVPYHSCARILLNLLHREPSRSRQEFYFVQHVAATCNTEIFCATSYLRGWQYGQQSFATCRATMLRDKLQENVALLLDL